MSTLVFRSFSRACSLILLLLIFTSADAANPVQLYATVQKTPMPQITLHLSGSTSYSIFRSISPGNFSGNWGTALTVTAASTWTDTDVVVGTFYEYRVVPANPGEDEAYILSGIEMASVDDRGKLILVVDNRYASELSFELNRLQRDLMADGWQVVRRDLSRDDSAAHVRSLIRAVYDADPAHTVAVFLLGHIPVVYSGWLDPDGHGSRPGPTDIYYADINGKWTDRTVNGDNSSIEAHWKNIPADGKYDQSLIASDVELEVGRVDFYDMTVFAQAGITERDLLRQYLNKDHDFRNKYFTADNRGAQMGSETGKYNFPQMFGTTPATQIPELDDNTQWFSTFESDSYLWLFKGGGGGNYTGTHGIGSTADFVTTPGVKIVFNSWFASLYWEWDVEDAFLRAPLAAKGHSLVNLWSENPDWVLHQMAMGKTIGAAARLSQNNNVYYNLQGYPIPGDDSMQLYRRGVYLNLLGDPSLRMHIIAPPSNVHSSGNTTRVISWTASPESGLLGYDIWRGPSSNGPFVKINSTPVTATHYDDTAATASSRYMIKAVKLETSSGSGTYINTSTGAYEERVPQILSVENMSAAQLQVIFDKALESTSAETSGNYHIDGGITVSSASLQTDTHTVVLTTSAHSDRIRYTLTANNIKDTQSPANTIGAATESYLYAEIPEFSSDAQTIALWHLNGDGNDVSGHGYALTLNGAAHFSAQGMGRVGSTRECLSVTHTSSATVNIPDDAILPNGGGASMTVEAWIYVNAWPQRGEAFAPVISARQAYNSYFELHFETWALPTGGSFGVGTLGPDNYVTLLDNAATKKVLQPGHWNHIALTFDGNSNQHNVYINRQRVVGPVTSPVNWGWNDPFTITLGNIDGCIDEVRLSNSVRPMTTLAPVVSANSPSKSTTPTWSWFSAAGGSGLYRYHLDDDVWSSDTAQLKFTPGSALTEASHVLYVQEKDADGFWSASGSFAVSIDVTPPATPNVSGSTPTNLQRPTWTWSSGGGGNGQYRFRLDSGSLSGIVSKLSFRPVSALTVGSHTLYVQERDEAGNWSAEGSFTIVVN